MEHTTVKPNELNEHLDQHPAPAPASDNTDSDTVERVEMRSRWFSVKLEEITTPTLIALAMILGTLISIVYIVAESLQ